MDDSPAVSAEDFQGDGHYIGIAQKHWLKSKVKKAKSEVIKTELWDYLAQEKFAASHVRLLESLQCLEKYLWPTYSEDATHYHVLLIVLILNAKRRDGLPSWSILADNPTHFASFFRRVLSLSLDKSFFIRIRTEVLVCIIGAFQSLDNGLIRKECALLVSIGIWFHLHNESTRDTLLEENGQFKKAWRAWNKRYEAADEGAKVRLRYERSWLYTLLLDFMNTLHLPELCDEDAGVYCERLMELLTDLQSQFPTRRYVNTLLRDLNLLVVIKLSPMYEDERSGLLRDLWGLLKHYTFFPIDDHTGRQLTSKEVSDIHHARIAQLQRTALKSFREKLNLLALASYGLLSQRQELHNHFEALTDDEMVEVAKALGYRTQYQDTTNFVPKRRFVRELLITSYEKPITFREAIKGMPLLPTEKVLYEPSFLRNQQFNGSRPLAMPKLNLQYLTTTDFLWRSFILFRCEAFYEIRDHVEETIRRLIPKRDKGQAQGCSVGTKMALRISKPAIVEVLPPKVGERAPAEVKAEITLDVSRLADNVRRDWENLRQDDVVYLVRTKQGQELTNGHNSASMDSEAPLDVLRAAEIIHVLDENGRPLKYAEPNVNGQMRRPRQRRLLVKLDAAAYAEDTKATAKGKPDVYESINTVVRRPSRENNFKSMLESIRTLALSDVPLPLWLQDVFLGMGDPAGAHYKNLPSSMKSLDFRDTFLDWQHLLDALPQSRLETAMDGPGSLRPPYVLEFSTEQAGHAQPSAAKKRRQDTPESRQTSDKNVRASRSRKENPPQPKRSSKKRPREEEEEEEEHEQTSEVVHVSTYKPANLGPYPTDVPPMNRVRFTPSQVESITSGTQPGLTVIVGPPGTGKTDVATQIINNLYHNFPHERILLVAHSNQALNQLFQKIVALDIDQRHLLRLGQGERELQLDSEANFGKQGRVEHFLERGSMLLSEVNRLAMSMQAPGAHGNSCETAEYFNSIYVRPVWKSYLDKAADGEHVDDIIQPFPFHDFFASAPQPLFPRDSSKEQALDIVTGCYRHIEKMFIELEDVRPFEVLRRDREKANYLLVQEARIIAMTSTHAAMRRQEIANLGFQYDTVIMEEAAQVTEVEAFIPLAMQKTPAPDHENSSAAPESRLKRVVLCGDHLQNSPIVQNNAVRQYANLEQSLFLRLIRLGVPHILLDAQGRARASLSDLYKWRYPALHNLPHVLTSPEFIRGNAGLQYDYQFIDVPDYKGKGETEPSPHFLQNLGEAEYAVALYMYMRLLGYPARQISILTTYVGQRALIRDVLAHRCAGNRLFGLPRVVSTVDKYQGEQNNCEWIHLTPACTLKMSRCQ